MIILLKRIVIGENYQEKKLVIFLKEWPNGTHPFTALACDISRWKTTSAASAKFSLIQLRNLTIVTFDGSFNILSTNGPTRRFQSVTYVVQKKTIVNTGARSNQKKQKRWGRKTKGLEAEDQKIYNWCLYVAENWPNDLLYKAKKNMSHSLYLIA